MKEKEFNKKLEKLHIKNNLIISIYYGLDDYNNVIDELQEIMIEKLNQIKEKKKIANG